MLESEQSIKIALRGITGAAVFDELGIEREDFFACTAGIDIGLLSACAALIWAWARAGLAAQVGIIELQQQLTLREQSHLLFTNKCFTVVAAGECFEVAEGSSFPLVEIRLRIAPRPTAVVRTRKGPGRVKTGMRATQRRWGLRFQPRAAFARGTSVRIVVGSCQLVIF